MDFRLSDDQDLLRRSVREFAEAEIRPHVMEWDEAQQFPMALLPKLAGLGLMGIQFPEENAAAPACRRSTTASASRSWRASVRAIALSVAAHNGLCSAHIGMFGNDEQKRTYLPRLVSGERARRLGVDRSQRRQRRGGNADDGVAGQRMGWTLNGAKSFITHGRIGGVMVVIAVTDRAKGIAGSRPSSSSTARQA